MHFSGNLKLLITTLCCGGYNVSQAANNDTRKWIFYGSFFILLLSHHATLHIYYCHGTVAVLITDTCIKENIYIIVCVVFLCFYIKKALRHSCQTYACVKLMWFFQHIGTSGIWVPLVILPPIGCVVEHLICL